MLTLTDVCHSRYLLHRMLADAFNPIRAALAVDVLLGPEPEPADDQVGEPLEWRPAACEPFFPDPSDEQDYLEWSDRLSASMPWPVEFPAHVNDADVAVVTGCA